MNRLRKIALLTAALLAAAASTAALAHGGGHHGHSRVSVGFVFGGPAYWGYPAYYHPYPYYYYPRVVGVPAEPTVYIERGDAAPAAQSQDYWYYCPEAKAYYPYVKHCAGPWQRVAPQPPPGG